MLLNMFALIKQKVEWFFDFNLTDFCSLDKFVLLMYQPRHASSLGIIRLLFGLLMLIDTLLERGGLQLVARWGNPQNCDFPLCPQIQSLGLYGMALIYTTMWLGALGIALGFKFRFNAALFVLSYWYILLLDKTSWNNHSYLFGVVSILLLGSSANSMYSLDALLDSSKYKEEVPFWNYFILRFQFFLLYFMAGLKKIDMEWLGGHSMVHWGAHWIFSPFRILLTTEEIDYLIIHWFGFVLDLTIGFWLLSGVTRNYAMLFSTAFHLMNSRLFSIGMFPYVCIVTTPIFCDDNWPIKIKNALFVTKNNAEICSVKKQRSYPTITWRHRTVGILLVLHCGMQCFLPYSHFITKGYNNWTNGLYGYSWDMMVHSWNSGLVVVKVRDNLTGKEHYLSPEAWTQNDRWSKHADMLIQYAQCVKKNLLAPQVSEDASGKLPQLSSNISIFVDVWCSLNGRFQQRMFDPNYDLLQANWSPFQPVEWLLPLLTESTRFRSTLKNVQDYVYTWSNHTDVLFIADFPRMHLENYLSTDLKNVSLTVLSGAVIYEIEDKRRQQSLGFKLTADSHHTVKTGMFHKVHTVSSTPSLYMYTYINQTRVEEENKKNI